MTEVFIIRNQHGHFWGKSKAWVDGRDARTLFRCKHEDEAINTVVELSAKDVELRGEVLPAELNDKGNPVVTPSDVPLPGAADAQADAETDETEGETPEVARSSPEVDPVSP